MLNGIEQEVESLPHSQSMLCHLEMCQSCYPLTSGLCCTAEDEAIGESETIEFLWPSPPFHIMQESKKSPDKKTVAMLQPPPTYSVTVSVVSPWIGSLMLYCLHFTPLLVLL